MAALLTFVIGSAARNSQSLPAAMISSSEAPLGRNIFSIVLVTGISSGICLAYRSSAPIISIFIFFLVLPRSGHIHYRP